MREQWSKLLGLTERDAGPDAEVHQVPMDMIKANRNQPRSVFDDAKLDELSATIRTHGIIQPIIVRRQDGYFEIIAGERRFRAAQKLGMDYIPAIVRSMTDAQAASVALIENLQREGLTAIEEATAYQQLIDLHHLTQESLAQRLGKGQSTIANKLRLLHLDHSVQEAVRDRQISERHARALLALSFDLQKTVMKEIIEKDLTVKQTENRVTTLLRSPVATKLRKTVFSRDVRLAINTIRESLKLIDKSGLSVQADEKELDDCFEFVIRIPKNK